MQAIITGITIGIFTVMIKVLYSIFIAPRLKYGKVRAKIATVISDNKIFILKPKKAEDVFDHSYNKSVDDIIVSKEYTDAHYNILKSKDCLTEFIENYPLIHIGIPKKEDLIRARKWIESLSIVWYSDEQNVSECKRIENQKATVRLIIHYLNIQSVDNKPWKKDND